MSGPAPASALPPWAEKLRAGGVDVAPAVLAGASKRDLGVVGECFAARPRCIEEVRRTLRIASEHGRAVVPRGAGTNLATGFPLRRVDLLLDTAALADVIAHESDDFVVHVQAGCSLQHLQGVVQKKGQWLPIETPDAGRATVGGRVASAAPSLLTASHGSLRHHLLGIRVCHASGELTRAGGRVVKNVAGYDLMKLYHGCHGTLGVVLEAIFRLRPLPESDRLLVFTPENSSLLPGLCERLLGLPVPLASAHYRHDPAGGERRVVLRFQGHPGAVQEQARPLLAFLRATPGKVEWIDDDPSVGEGRQQVEQLLALLGRGADSTALASVHARPSQLAAVMALVMLQIEASGLPAPAWLIDLQRGRIWLRFRDPQPLMALAALLGDLRAALAAEQIPVTLSSGPIELRRAFPPFVLRAGERLLHTRLAEQLDPDGVLSPGRMLPVLESPTE